MTDSSNSKETGLRLSKSLVQLLEVLPSQAETKLVEAVSRSFGRGHPPPEEASTKMTASLVRDFVKQLQQDPTRRHFVVDRDTLLTDDSGWLTLVARCSPAQNNSNKDDGNEQPHVQWAITTVRSLERSVFDHCFQVAAGGDWRIQHANGPRGSAVVSNKRTGEDCCQQAFFSDMPKCVAATGRQLGLLYPKQCVIRVLRTAPRASLTQGLTRVLEQPNVPDNVFTLWIRHHERVQDLPGMGRFRYESVTEAKNHNRCVLDLLTAIEQDEEDAQRPTSPLAYDFVQASQANFQRCRPDCSPSNNNSTSLRSINAPEVSSSQPRQQSDVKIETAPSQVPVNLPDTAALRENDNHKNSVAQKQIGPLSIQMPDLSIPEIKSSKEEEQFVDKETVSAKPEESSNDTDPKPPSAETTNDSTCLRNGEELRMSENAKDKLDSLEIPSDDTNVQPVLKNSDKTPDGRGTPLVLYTSADKATQDIGEKPTQSEHETGVTEKGVVDASSLLDSDDQHKIDPAMPAGNDISNIECDKSEEGFHESETNLMSELNSEEAVSKKMVSADDGGVASDKVDESFLTANSKAFVSSQNDALSLLGSPDKPTLLGLDPMGLAMALSLSMEVQPEDTQFDDVLIQPTFSFDEDEEVKPATDIVVDTKEACAEDTTTTVGRETATPEQTSSDPQNLAAKEDIKDEEMVVVNHTERATDSHRDNTNKDAVPSKTAEQRKSPPSKETKKTVFCVVCQTKKPKTDFSNNQLKKKKNTKCMACVRSNTLGPSNNENA